ncbi:hypothetical protein [Mesorhizobium escarrei]|nr:hypothetical protein [Mesorhizobium escarrei]
MARHLTLLSAEGETRLYAVPPFKGWNRSSFPMSRTASRITPATPASVRT